ncbi:CXADR-like membrane protein [Synchiropus picturatus]
MSAIVGSLCVVLVGLLSVDAQTEMKKVVGDNATLPCHHQLPSSNSLDIEWLLQKPNSKQKVIITFFGGHIYFNEATGNEASRLSFAGDYLRGDTSLLISDLAEDDSGEYYCKVKTGGKYHWSQVNLVVLVKPSKPICWMDGKPSEGSDVKLNCKSSDGSEPINYKWERVLERGKSLGKLPNLALIDLKNPEIVTLRNLTMDSTGVYRCTASNDVGEENCTVEVPMERERKVGEIVGAVVGFTATVVVLSLLTWLVRLIFRKKEKKKYEEEETPNEIREDAEAPKAKLVKPNSLSSSRSGSSRSGASSTQSMVHNSIQRGHRPRPPPAVAALKENGQPPGFPQSPPAYTTVVSSKTPEPPVTPKYGSRNMSGPTPPTLMVPAQTKAFQTV